MQDLEASPLSHDEIKSIISAVLGGEIDAYRHLVLSFENRIFSIVVRSVCDEQIAKDILQETFINAYLNLATFRFESKFETWLTRIALNLVTSYFRSRQNKWRLRSSPFKLEVHDQIAEVPQEDRYDQNALQQLRQAAASLPDQYREVYVLCGCEGRSYEEVSAILGIPIGTVRSRLNRARNKIQKIYFEAK